MTQALAQLVLNILSSTSLCHEMGTLVMNVYTRLRWRADHHISTVTQTGLSTKSASVLTHRFTLWSRAGPEVAQHLLQHGARWARRWVACAHGRQVPPELSARHFAHRAQALLVPSAHTPPRAIPCILSRALLHAFALPGRPAALTALEYAAAALSCSWNCAVLSRRRLAGFCTVPRRQALHVPAPRQQHRQRDAHAPIQTCAALRRQHGTPVPQPPGPSRFVCSTALCRKGRSHDNQWPTPVTQPSQTDTAGGSRRLSPRGVGQAPHQGPLWALLLPARTFAADTRTSKHEEERDPAAAFHPCHELRCSPPAPPARLPFRARAHMRRAPSAAARARTIVAVNQHAPPGRQVRAHERQRGRQAPLQRAPLPLGPRNGQPQVPPWPAAEPRAAAWQRRARAGGRWLRCRRRPLPLRRLPLGGHPATWCAARSAPGYLHSLHSSPCQTWGGRQAAVPGAERHAAAQLGQRRGAPRACLHTRARTGPPPARIAMALPPTQDQLPKTTLGAWQARPSCC